MRRVVVNRRTILGSGIPDPSRTVGMLDRLGVPDGLPFLIEDDGSFTGVASVNRYMREAYQQGGLDLGSLRLFHSYHLARLLQFLRERAAQQDAAASGLTVDDWRQFNAEPKTDLTSATSADLVAYKEHRLASVAASSWNSEISSVGGFFHWAVKAGLIAKDPIPRWGQRRRNTLAARDYYERQPKYLTEPQLLLFLRRGLLAEGEKREVEHRERNYAFGLLLATTGLRREEGALILDSEIPAPHQMPTNGVATFTRIGKGEVPRFVFIARELADAVDLYRQTERAKTISAAQKRLRRELRDGALLVCAGVRNESGKGLVARLGAKWIPATRLTNEQRARLVRIEDDGTIEPMAFFVSRLGLPLSLDMWNKVFTEARHRVAASGSPHRPPEHLTVVPHTMRHTYAVRMLSALMKQGRDTHNDPYLLLANPVLTVMQLLGHADVSTTQMYLFAAEGYNDALPASLRAVAATTLASAEPGGGEQS